MMKIEVTKLKLNPTFFYSIKIQYYLGISTTSLILYLFTLFLHAIKTYSVFFFFSLSPTTISFFIFTRLNLTTMTLGNYNVVVAAVLLCVVVLLLLFAVLLVFCFCSARGGRLQQACILFIWTNCLAHFQVPREARFEVQQH
jgi:hypothetical protein